MKHKHYKKTNNSENKQNAQTHKHYYSEDQDGEFIKNKITSTLLGNQLEFMSGPGIFSKERVDKGTRILVENCIVKKEWNVLDLGSGIGIVGIAVAKKYDCNVVMTEINKRAYMLSKENAIINRVKDNIVALQGNMFESVDKKELKNFDAILLNPPQTAGKQLCFEMIRLSKEHLKDGGMLQIVARHNKGGKTLSEYMNEVFGNMETIAKESGYRVYVSKKETDNLTIQN